MDKDLQVKSKIYAKAGTPKYWVVNLRTRGVIVFRDPTGEDYRSQRVMATGLVNPPSFPKLQIEVARLAQ